MARKAHKIDTESQRAKLPPRREPYWAKVEARGYVGFRRTATGGTWIARFRHLDGKQEYNALQLPLTTPEEGARDAAGQAARAWFEALVTGSVKAGSGGYRVSEAAAAYVEDRRARKGEGAARDAQGRINRKLEKSPLWDRRVDRLTTEEIEEWLYGMVPAGLDEEETRQAKDSANRNLTTLRAILNKAWKAKKVSSPNAWAVVRPFEDVAKSRRVFLRLDQRRRLLEQCKGPFRDLLEAAMLTGARYGELRQLRVEDFDKAERRLEIHKGKTGIRTVALSDSAHAFFVRVSKGKLPGAPLLPRPDGEPWAHSDQDELMRSAVKAAKLPRETVFYTLRHSHVMEALKAGIDIATIAKNCGTSVRIIESNYHKFLPGDLSKKLSKVEFA